MQLRLQLRIILRLRLCLCFRCPCKCACLFYGSEKPALLEPSGLDAVRSSKARAARESGCASAAAAAAAIVVEETTMPFLREEERLDGCVRMIYHNSSRPFGSHSRENWNHRKAWRTNPAHLPRGPDKGLPREPNNNS